MTNDRKLRLMQEALDDNLTPEAESELAHLLENDPDDAEQFDKLQQVDHMLRNTPFERAPERLALTIMARLAETMKKQQPTELDEAMMQVAMSVVMVSTMPLLLGASWLILNARSRPQTVNYMLYQVAGMLILVIDVMKVMLEEAEAAYEDNPAAALALLSMMPATLLELVKQVLEAEDRDDD